MWARPAGGGGCERRLAAGLCVVQGEGEGAERDRRCAWPRARGGLAHLLTMRILQPRGRGCSKLLNMRLNKNCLLNAYVSALEKRVYRLLFCSSISLLLESPKEWCVPVFPFAASGAVGLFPFKKLLSQQQQNSLAFATNIVFTNMNCHI